MATATKRITKSNRYQVYRQVPTGVRSWKLECVASGSTPKQAQDRARKKLDREAKTATHDALEGRWVTPYVFK